MAPLLLDSHVAVWLAQGSARLGAHIRQQIVQAPAVYVSAASAWELRLKQARGKLELPAGFEAALLASGLKELPLTLAHVAAVAEVKLPYQDPFDRILIAQALADQLILLTADRTLLTSYPQQTLSVLTPPKK